MSTDFETRNPILELLPREMQARYRFTHRVEIDHSQLSAAAVTETLSFAVPAGSVIVKAAHVVKEAFDAPTATAIKLDVGNDAESDNFIDNKELHLGSVDADSYQEPGVVIAAADNIDVKFTLTGDNVADLTQGKLVLLFDIINITQVAVE